ncbi:hypothetical protein EZV62_022349 [Acer yangbiense]|uniref:Reverse transcriptase Ty1/copia-type domain-containing protein n=1 Tax=Acer yangbiense TaxID=1000413 RepID=A0A5C7H858_9ROSI|nr:hypothetical protein EZV62_022349 [Acer yangbiense]
MLKGKNSSLRSLVSGADQEKEVSRRRTLDQNLERKMLSVTVAARRGITSRIVRSLRRRSRKERKLRQSLQVIWYPKIMVYFKKEKAKVFERFKEWKAEVENQTGRKIKYLRSDNREFDMKDLGVAKKIIGMETKKDRKTGKLWLSQKMYIHKVLEKFSMLDAKAVFTPLASHFVLSAKKCPSTDAEMEEMVKYWAALTAALTQVTMHQYLLFNLWPPSLWLELGTYTNRNQTVSVVAKYMVNPGKEHWNAIKWILRYLKGTKELGIMFERQHGETNIVGFVDSNYAGDLDKRRSTMGYVFTCADGPISWRSMLQPTTALSTTEAEYMAITKASKEATWLRGLVNDMGLKQNSVLLRCDSQSTVALTKNQVFHARTKHIDTRFHRIRDWIASGEVSIEKVHMDENASDMLTKPVTKDKFKHCLSLLNLFSC